MSWPSFRSLRRGRRRSALAVVLLMGVVAAATGCDGGPPPPENPPYWLPGSKVVATNYGPLVHIAWDAPEGGDPVSAYQINLEGINGPGVALLPASVRSCFIVGLAPNNPVTIYVTARDAQMHWSGPLEGTHGNRKTSITTAKHGVPAGTKSCHAGAKTDGDADGLPDVLETDDGTWASVTDTGTDPTNPDTDNDGVSDGDEALGRENLNLIAMGGRPTKKDLYIETDWFHGGECSLRPTPERLAPMIDAFTDAPTSKVTNPDGTQGINVIIDYGQGAPFNGGNSILDPDPYPVNTDARFSVDDSVFGDPFKTAMAANFKPVRAKIFRYVIVHGGSSSNATGDRASVASYCPALASHPRQFPGHLMHEIGHTLGIGHAGPAAAAGWYGYSIPSADYDWSAYFCDQPNSEHCIHWNRLVKKPNYVSIMNYYYTPRMGLNDSCLRPTEGETRWLDYSSGGRPTIDEMAVNEAQGICGNGVPIDWNGNGVIDPTPYQFDIDNNGYFTPLHDQDDWGYINEMGLALLGNSD